MIMAVVYIIDAGISEKARNKYSSLCNFVCQYNISDGSHPPEIEDYPKSNDFHGDIVYRIITKSKKAPSDIYTFKILDGTLKASYSQLEDAFKIILAINIPGIVNLSLGMVDSRHQIRLKRCIDRLAARGIYTICATSVYKSYPMLLPNVIRVADAEFINRLDCSEDAEKLVDFTFSVDMKTCPFMPLNSPSYATPFITAVASDMMENETIRSIYDLKRSLKNHFKGVGNA